MGRSGGKKYVKRKRFQGKEAICRPWPDALLSFIRLLFGIDNGIASANLWRRLVRIIVVAHAFFEAFDTLGNVAHHVGKTTLTEQKQHQNAYNQPMPDAKSTHFKLLSGRTPAVAADAAVHSYTI
jgi:hypothetical protein